MQPTYLPWAGYFYLCASVDTFVFLDDVQFERKSWQSKNRILLSGCEQILTVPTNKVGLDTLIKAITVSNITDWVNSHITKIGAAYPYFTAELELMKSIKICMNCSDHLVDINISLIQYFLGLLDIRCKTVRASELNVGGKRSVHLANICHALNGTAYLSPIGSRDYLESDNFPQISGVELTYSNFYSTPYEQRNAEAFTPNLSVLDIIGNHGIDFTKKYVRGSFLP